MAIYFVTKKLEVHAAHKLDLPYQSKCNGLHGHTYKLEITLCSDSLDPHGMVMDFNFIKRTIDNELDHKYLNEVLCNEINTTTEVLCKWIGELFPNFTYKIVALESENNKVVYYNTNHPLFKQLGICI